jgi:hypothetical protein
MAEPKLRQLNRRDALRYGFAAAVGGGLTLAKLGENPSTVQAAGSRVEDTPLQLATLDYSLNIDGKIVHAAEFTVPAVAYPKRGPLAPDFNLADGIDVYVQEVGGDRSTKYVNKGFLLDNLGYAAVLDHAYGEVSGFTFKSATGEDHIRKTGVALGDQDLVSTFGYTYEDERNKTGVTIETPGYPTAFLKWKQLDALNAPHNQYDKRELIVIGAPGTVVTFEGISSGNGVITALDKNYGYLSEREFWKNIDITFDKTPQFHFELMEIALYDVASGALMQVTIPRLDRSPRQSVDARTNIPVRNFQLAA